MTNVSVNEHYSLLIILGSLLFKTARLVQMVAYGCCVPTGRLSGISYDVWLAGFPSTCTFTEHEIDIIMVCLLCCSHNIQSKRMTEVREFQTSALHTG